MKNATEPRTDTLISWLETSLASAQAARADWPQAERAKQNAIEDLTGDLAAARAGLPVPGLGYMTAIEYVRFIDNIRAQRST